VALENAFGEATPAVEVASFLESAPLYKPIAVHARGPGGSGPFTQDQLDKQRVWFPKEISIYCDHSKCRRDMIWETHSGTYVEQIGVSVQPSNGFQSHTYTCRHCGVRRVTFFLLFSPIKIGIWSLQKIGQSPRKQPVLSAELLQSLGENGQGLYQRAVESRNQDMGLGALAYLRRVVEDAMNALLDLMEVAVVGSESEETMLEAIQVAKVEKVFTNKVAFAKAILPARCFHGGHNPLERLHDWASAGIHNRDDWECAEIFDEIRALFEMLFERLARESSEKKLYDQKLINLTRKK
jgi:hypothetical protein